MGLFSTIKSAFGGKSSLENTQKHRKGKKYMIFILNYFGYPDDCGRNEKKCPEKLKNLIINSCRNRGVHPSDDSEIVMPAQFYKDVIRTEIGIDNKKLPSDVELAITEYMYPETKGQKIIITAPQLMAIFRDLKFLFVLMHTRGDTSKHFE